MVTRYSKPGTDEHFIQEHLHGAQLVAPSELAPIAVTSDGVAWTLGNFSNDILATDAVANPFDLHWIVVEGPSANAWYEIVIYYGGTDIECARVAFGRTAVFTNSISVPVMTPILPTGSRVRAKMMDSAGGSSVNIKVFYHTY